MNCTKLHGHYKKGNISRVEKILRVLASLFKRRQFCLELNPLMVVKVNVIINQRFCHGKIFDFMSVDAFSFEDGKEILS